MTFYGTFSQLHGQHKLINCIHDGLPGRKNGKSSDFGKKKGRNDETNYEQIT